MRLELEGMRRLVQGDPHAEWLERQVEGGGRAADVLLDEQQPPVDGLGRHEREVVLPEHFLAHEAEQEAQLASRHVAVGDGHGRLAETTAGRHDLVEQLTLNTRDERGEGRHVGGHPAGAVDDAGSLDDAGQLRSERLGEPWDDRGHRRGVSGFGSLQLLCRERARRVSQAGDGDPLRLRPVHQAAPRRPLGVAADDGRSRAQCRADQEAHLPHPVIPPAAAPACPLAHRRPPSTAVGVGLASVTRMPVTLPNASPNRRAAMRRKAVTSPVVSWAWIR